MLSRTTQLFLSCLLAAFCFSCGSLALADDEPLKQPDRLEGLNRQIFAFNMKMDKYFIRPIAKTYNKIMPAPLNRGLDNFFYNTNGITTVVNDALQADFYHFSADSWRLMINSTAGVGGLFDFAADMDIPRHKETFGLTFARWGYLDSSYLVLPILGPSTVRDSIGMIGSYYLSINRLYPSNMDVSIALFTLELLDDRARLLRFQETYDTMALDPYVFTRSAYFQNRAYLIKQNKEQVLPDKTAKEIQLSKSSDDRYLDSF